jgi:zinc and cadmium transporter
MLSESSMPTTTLTIYCLTIIAASLLGGAIPLLIKLTHTRMQLAISFIAGFMLGVGVLHMLPDALNDIPPTTAVNWLVAGLLVMFFIERFFSFHHHDVPEDEHDHDHNHDHDHAHGRQLTWSGAAVGMTLHSIVAGVALGAAVADATQSQIAWPGLAVFLVIVLHKPLDALTIMTLTTMAGFSKTKRHMINSFFALAVPVGAILFLVGFQTTIEQSPTFVGCALAFSAGTFLCISLSDLLPELQFHHHDRIKLSIALLLGLALAWSMGKLEHQLHHEHTPPAVHHHIER